MENNQKIYKFPRVCSISGEGMWEGYCFGDGEEYAKEKEFAETIARRNGYATLQESYDDGHHYWTEWYDEGLDEDGWYESEHEDGRDAVWVDAGLPPVTMVEFGSVVFEFIPSERDEWQSDGVYDYHYDLDNNEVCVYRIVDGVTDVSNTIHKQTIQSPER